MSCYKCIVVAKGSLRKGKLYIMLTETLTITISTYSFIPEDEVAWLIAMPAEDILADAIFVDAV